MHISARVLKSRQLVANESAQAPILSLQLMAPAFEPTLLARMVLDNREGEPFSLQFVAEDGHDYHYMNLPFDNNYQINTPVEYVVVADLPLLSKVVWRVFSFPPGSDPLQIGELRQDSADIWRYAPLGADVDHAPRKKQDTSVLFVGGAPKSGTTWVERILNSHPDALATGENNFFDWPPRGGLKALMNASPPPYYAYAVPQSAPFRAQMVHFYIGRAEGILTQVADVARVRLVADKTPTNSLHLPEMLSVRPNWLYIHCLRNPLDVAVSRFFHERNLLANTPSLSFLNTQQLRAQVADFDSHTYHPGDMFRDVRLLDLFIDESLVGIGAADLAAKQSTVHLVHYESLLQDPHETVRAIYDFCGLSSEGGLIASVVQANSFEAYSGGRHPGQANEKEFFRKGIVGDHLNYLTHEQIQYAVARIRLSTSHFDRYFH